MKRLLIVALLALSAACQNQTTVNAELPVLEIDGTLLGDQLPVDGCGPHLFLNLSSTSSDSRTYERLPTEATRSLMDNMIKAEVAKQPPGTLWMGNKAVTIRYRETGQTAFLLCGWNAKQELKTIELLDIRER